MDTAPILLDPLLTRADAVIREAQRLQDELRQLRVLAYESMNYLRKAARSRETGDQSRLAWNPSHGSDPIP